MADQHGHQIAGGSTTSLARGESYSLPEGLADGPGIFSDKLCVREAEAYLGPRSKDRLDLRKLIQVLDVILAYRYDNFTPT